MRNLQKNNRRFGFLRGEDKVLLSELKQDLDRAIRPSKDIIVDDIVIQSQAKKQKLRPRENMPDIANRYQNGKYVTFDTLPRLRSPQNRVNEDLLELIYGEQEKDSSKLNIWHDEIDSDPYQRKARDILEYDHTKQFMDFKSDDPILQAHSEISIKYRKRESSRPQLRIPNRYLKHRIHKWRFNFEKILSAPEPNVQHPKKSLTQSRTRVASSKTSRVVSKDHILDSESPLRGTMQFSIKDANLANIDILGIRF